MATKRRRFTAEFKAKVVMEALRGDRTIKAIAAKHEVHPNQISNWKRQAQVGLRELFADGRSRRQKEYDATIHDLHAKIAELTVERDFLHAGSGAEPGQATRDDRAGARPSEREPAVPTDRAEPVDVVLPSGGRECRDAGVDATHRRVVPRVPVLRQPADDAPSGPRREAGRSAPGATADAAVGVGGDLPQAAVQRREPGPPHYSHPDCRAAVAPHSSKEAINMTINCTLGEPQ